MIILFGPFCVCLSARNRWITKCGFEVKVSFTLRVPHKSQRPKETKYFLRAKFKGQSAERETDVSE